MLEELYEKYDKLQKKYGDKSLHSIYFGGKKEHPKICFVFLAFFSREKEAFLFLHCLSFEASIF